MENKVSKELAWHRLEQAKEDIMACDLLYNGKLYKSANNRAYYAIFHSIRSVLALEPIDFKRHKDVIAYFNKNYVNTEIFPKSIGRRIARANQVREDSDYDDEFIVDPNNTLVQIKTAKELVKLVEQYLNEKTNNM